MNENTNTLLNEQYRREAIWALEQMEEQKHLCQLYTIATGLLRKEAQRKAQREGALWYE